LFELARRRAYQRRSVDSIDQRIINHVREYETITNRAVQNLIEVGLTRARNILADMVKRKLLKKTSAHQRGPGVAYGPGPAFPKLTKKRAAKKR
jgi:ATP-dependent DNA helicase RecG